MQRILIRDQIGNEDIHNMQTKDDEKKDHQNRKTYKDISVKDLEKLPNRNGSRWRRKNPERRQMEEVEFIHCYPTSTFMMKSYEGDHFLYDRHDYSPQNHNDDHFHDEQSTRPSTPRSSSTRQQLGHHQHGHHQQNQQPHY